MDPDTLPMLPVPIGSDTPWPTLSISREERLDISSGNLPKIKLGTTDGQISDIIVEMQPVDVTMMPSKPEPNSPISPKINRSYRSEKIDIITSEPPSMLTFFIPDISLEKPSAQPYLSTSSLFRRIRSRSTDT